MAYKLQLKRGASGSLPTGSAGEPLFTTDTNDLYIGTGGANQRFQKYIASGTSAQFLKGDGSLDSTTYTPTSRTLTINGTSFDLSANRTFNVGTVTTAAATTGGQVAFFNGATVITSVSGLYFDGVDKLGIGTASPTYNLDVTGTARMTSSSNLQTLYLQNSGTGYGLYNQADSYFQGDVKFQSVSNTILKVDSSNKLIAAVAGTDYQAPITNPVTGTGTTNYIPKWTSGSAIGNSLVYDSGTAIGIGTSSPLYKADIKGGNASTLRLDNDGSQYVQLLFERNTVSNSGFDFLLDGTNSTINMRGLAVMPIVFSTSVSAGSPTEKMRLTTSGNLLLNSSTDNGNRLQVTGNGYFSGNLGVGTSSPGFWSGKLTVDGGDIAIASGGRMLFWNAAGNGIASIQGTSTNELVFQTSGLYTERMRLDSSGNLGLSVVPSAWVSGAKAIDIGIYSSIFQNSNGYPEISFNNYESASGTYKYKQNDLATRYEQYNGQHRWFNAPSGTAGNAITFTQAMTLDASGRLGVGVTNMSSYNAGGNQFVIGGGEFRGLTIAATTEGNIYFADGTTGADTYRGTIGYNHTTNYLYFFTDGTERARITASGRLLLGTTTEGTDLLDVNGTGRFSGNLLVTTTSGSGLTINTNDVTTLRMTSSGGTKNWAFATTNLAASDFGIYQSIAGGGDPINAGSAKLYFNGSGAATFSSSVTATRYLVTPDGSNAVYNFVNSDNTYTGSYVFQAGGGSAGFGGAIVAYGHSHATKPGWITAGISSNSGGKFTVNTQGLGGGTDVFVVQANGNCLVGTSTDSGEKLQVSGSVKATQLDAYTSEGGSKIGSTHGTGGTYPKASGISFGATSTSLSVSNNGGTTTFTGGAGIYANNSAASNNPTDLVLWTTSGGSPAERMRIKSDGKINFSSLPTSATGLSAGDIWNDGGTLKIV